MTTETCVLTFNTSLGQTRAVRIGSPRTNLPPQVIAMAASGFISANPFDEGIGSLTGLARAERIVETRTDLL